MEAPEDWPWSDRLADIRARIEERTPAYLGRFDDLAYLRRLLDCMYLIDALVEEATQGDLFLGAVFDPRTLDETLAITRTPGIVPGALSNYIRGEEAEWCHIELVDTSTGTTVLVTTT